MMFQSTTPSPYLFSRRELGLLIEIYFPKRVLYQTEITQSLVGGVDEEEVKTYLKEFASELTVELAEYPFVLDPNKYVQKHRIDPSPISPEEAKKRMDKYESPFFGWSTHDVQGAFLSKKKKTKKLTATEKRKMIDDELTQIVRIIFLFESRYLKNAKKKGCEHIVRSIASWIMANYYHRMPIVPWSKTEKDRFLSEQDSLLEHELWYIKNHYIDIAREVIKWFDDTVLFCFGYLVRRFWTHVQQVGRKEDEIWVTSLLDVGINVVKPGARYKPVIK